MRIWKENTINNPWMLVVVWSVCVWERKRLPFRERERERKKDLRFLDLLDKLALILVSISWKETFSQNAVVCRVCLDSPESHIFSFMSGNCCCNYDMWYSAVGWFTAFFIMVKKSHWSAEARYTSYNISDICQNDETKWQKHIGKSLSVIHKSDCWYYPVFLQSNYSWLLGIYITVVVNQKCSSAGLNLNQRVT